MAYIDTISDLFTAAIAAEDAALDFYKGLTQSFSDVPEVSHFWEDMMRDEAYHVQELTDIRDALSEEQLNEPADQSMIRKAKDELKRFEEKLDLESIATLDDAYEIAYELEYSEVNVVFQAIITRFVPVEVKSNFVYSEVREHVAKLEHFSKMIANSERRRTILARHH